jgi:hypothetical protein
MVLLYLLDWKKDMEDIPYLMTTIGPDLKAFARILSGSDSRGNVIAAMAFACLEIKLDTFNDMPEIREFLYKEVRHIAGLTLAEQVNHLEAAIEAATPVPCKL